MDEEHSARAEFAGATGFSVRRVHLHQILVSHAIEAGVEFRWGTRVLQYEDDSVATAKENYPIVGSSARMARTRKSENGRDWIRGLSEEAIRFLHSLSGGAVVGRGRGSLDARLPDIYHPMRGRRLALPYSPMIPDSGWRARCRGFPTLRKNCEEQHPQPGSLGDTTSLRILPAVARSRVALVGDASGTVDAVTGHGLSLSFQQAIPLAEAMKRDDLAHYQRAHKKIAAVPITMTRLMLLMGGNDWIRRRTIRLFQNTPGLFSRLLAIHTETTPLSSVGLAEIAGFGWKFLLA